MNTKPPRQPGEVVFWLDVSTEKQLSVEIMDRKGIITLTRQPLHPILNLRSAKALLMYISGGRQLILNIRFMARYKIGDWVKLSSGNPDRGVLAGSIGEVFDVYENPPILPAYEIHVRSNFLGSILGSSRLPVTIEETELLPASVGEALLAAASHGVASSINPTPTKEFGAPEVKPTASAGGSSVQTASSKESSGLGGALLLILFLSAFEVPSGKTIERVTKVFMIAVIFLAIIAVLVMLFTSPSRG